MKFIERIGTGMESFQIYFWINIQSFDRYSHNVDIPDVWRMLSNNGCVNATAGSNKQQNICAFTRTRDVNVLLPCVNMFSSKQKHCEVSTLSEMKRRTKFIPILHVHIKREFVVRD